VVESKTVHVVIHSKPEGARVAIPGKSPGTTPYTTDLNRSSEPVKITVTLAGHRPETRTIIPKGDTELAVELARAKPVRRVDKPDDSDAHEPDDTKNPFERLKKK